MTSASEKGNYMTELLFVFLNDLRFQKKVRKFSISKIEISKFRKSEISKFGNLKFSKFLFSIRFSMEIFQKYFRDFRDFQKF